MNAIPTVGIIANPASGKDIRRLVAHGSSFDNNEKINIVRRILVGLEAVGVDRIWYMPDPYGLVPRAAEPIGTKLEIRPLPMDSLANSSDSLEAAQRLRDLGVGCIVTLGGDGTNRVVAKGCGTVPLVAVSTGTNNVFPQMVEGTLAGIAAGLVATRSEVRHVALRHVPKLVVMADGADVDEALIDVVTSPAAWVGARALWDPGHLREIVLSRVQPAAIGICGLGGFLFPSATGTALGVHVVVGGDRRRVVTALAPGLVKPVPVEAARLVDMNSTVEIDGSACTVALDGEREFEILKPGRSLHVRLDSDGPWVVDIESAIQRGAELGAFAAKPAVIA